jgi:hypothetical protein
MREASACNAHNVAMPAPSVFSVLCVRNATDRCDERGHDLRHGSAAGNRSDHRHDKRRQHRGRHVAERARG